MAKDQTNERIMQVRIKLERARRQAVEPDAINLAEVLDDLAFLMMEIVDRLPSPQQQEMK
jgi:hypothetical protein